MTRARGFWHVFLRSYLTSCLLPLAPFVSPPHVCTVVVFDVVVVVVVAAACAAVVCAVPIPSYLIALAVGDLVGRAIGPRSTAWSEPIMLDAVANEVRRLVLLSLLSLLLLLLL